MESTLTINNLVIEQAKVLCSVIKDGAIFERAIKNVVAAKIAQDVLRDIEVDSASGLCNIPLILNKIDISDVYINNQRIDVRLVFEGETLTVPRSHYDKSLLPFAYMFLKFDPESLNVELIGYVLANKINFLEEDSDYCTVDEEILIDNSEFFSALLNADLKYPSELTKEVEISLFDCVDGKLNDLDSDALLRFLVQNIDARLKLKDIYSVQRKFDYLSSDVESSKGAGTSLTLDDLIENDHLQESLQAQQANLEETSLQEEEVLDDLFDQKVVNAENLANKKKNTFLPTLLCLLVLGGGGYFAYSKYFMQGDMSLQGTGNLKNEINAGGVKTIAKSPEEQMPIESIENESINNAPVELKEDINASIPTLEQNIGYSISISNLKINWEVSSSYTSNSSVYKYLIKLGKIIQLNLKTELLLLSKQPLTNKVSLEIELDKKLEKFVVKKIIASSGEASVDKVIEQTVQSVLQSDIKFNKKHFESLVGNPILHIHL